MKIENEQGDAAILRELGARLTRLRLDRALTQEELASQASVSKRTIERLETGQSVQASNLVRVLRALHLLAQLEALIPAAAPGPIEQLKHRGKTRHRASAQKQTGRWTWADGQ